MFAARITLAHFSVSSAISLPKSAGDPTSGAAPKSANRALILASVRAGTVLAGIDGFTNIMSGIDNNAAKDVRETVRAAAKQKLRPRRSKAIEARL